MNPSQKESVKLNYTDLVRDITDLNTVLDHLFVSDVIDEIKKTELQIYQQDTAHQKARLLLDYIMRKNAFDFFIQSLQKSGNGHLANALLAKEAALRESQEHNFKVSKSGSFVALSDDESETEVLTTDATPIINVKVDPVVSPAIMDKLHQPKSVYPMTFPVRGRCLMIHNADYSRSGTEFRTVKLPNRRGAEYDVTNLKTVFQALGFNVGLQLDLTREEMVNILEEERFNPDHQDMGAFIVLISSHGDRNSVFGVDGRRLSLDFLYESFDGRRCPYLTNKPKVIFIESSMGTKVDYGVIDQPSQEGRSTHSDGSILGSYGDTPAARPASGEPRQYSHTSHASRRVAEKADLLVCLSAFMGYSSMRNSSQGCWFSRALVEVLMKHAKGDSMTSLLRRVRRKMAQVSTDKGVKQTCVTIDTLTKEFYLFPGV